MRLLHAARLSQDRGSSQTGIESADKACAVWAQGNGHEIIATAADKKSGTIQPWNRPNLKPWVTQPEKLAQYDGIIAYRFDRLSRGDKQSTNEIEKWAHDNGKILLTEDGLVFPSEGADGIRWDLTARLAHEEWLKASERYSRMQKHLRDNNYLTGRPPFGFKVVTSDNHKTLAADPATAPYLLQAIELYLSGKSLRAVCDWLDTVVPTAQGKGWQVTSLAKIFRNECLIGRRKDGNGRTILKFDALITPEKFSKLQATVAQRATRKAVPTADTALLTSMAFCGNCGGRVYRANTHGRVYYRCMGHYPESRRCGLMVRLSELDGFVSRLFSPERMGNRPEIETIVTPGQGHDDEISLIEQDIRDLDLDDPSYDAKLTSLRSERLRLKTLPATPSATEKRETGRTWHQVWTSLDDAQKRSWLLDAGLQVKVRKPAADSVIMWRMDSPYLSYDQRDLSEVIDGLDLTDDDSDQPCESNDLGFCRFCGKDMEGAA